MTMIEMGKKAKESAYALSCFGTDGKNLILDKAAKALVANIPEILKANQKDVDLAIGKGVKASLIDRLRLDEKRIEDMASGILMVKELPDPIGEVISMNTLPNGLIVGKKRVPLGVIGIIFEARPNVAADAFALCFKAGNAVILRGGKEAINSNMAIVGTIRKAIELEGLNADVVQLVEDISHETAKEMMKLNGYIDVLIPRGGAGLIKTVVENSTVPIIETGTGNCHLYVDETADFKKAIDILINGKTQRTGVCNALESLLVNEKIADKFVPLAIAELNKYGVEIRGDKAFQKASSLVKEATDEDYAAEFLDLIISAKVVADTDEAISHIRKYSTGHSETIVTESYSNAQKFLNNVDSAAVYVNASTRFTDGAQFGYGAEIGISTQKLHARGPMGLKELTSYKYIIYGEGQIRE
ncbi:MAG: glutamate-5-semialdehyde dehydrogenase [Lachnospiraceae bacterium]|nr:glutamate-5-semialdehyde dehydrogenase [Lachnospiraceae bacterium]